MNKKKILVPFVLLVLVLIAAFLFWRSHHKDETPTLYGNVDVRELSLAFRVAGRVSEVLVQEGTRVKTGDALAKLDTEPLHNALLAAQAQLAAISARNQLLHQGTRKQDKTQAQARAKAAQAALEEANAQLQRQTELLKVGASTQRVVDAAAAAQAQALAQLSIAQEQVQLQTEGYRKEEIAESDALVAQARVAVSNAQLALRDAVLTAPVDAVVQTQAIEVGSMVSAGSPAMSLSITDPVWVRAYVNEPQLGRFGAGTAVSVQTDSRPQKPYHGRIGFVSPTAEFTPKSVETQDLRTALVYRIRIVIDDPDTQLRQGMPVTIQLAQ